MRGQLRGRSHNKVTVRELAVGESDITAIKNK